MRMGMKRGELPADGPPHTKEILIYKESLYKPIASCSLLISLCVERSMVEREQRGKLHELYTELIISNKESCRNSK
jgi:hypothetical protein